MSAKKAIVTGGSKGIGSGIVRRLAAQGWDVVFSYGRHAEDALALRDELKNAHGVRCECFAAALEVPGNGKRLFEQATEFLGGLDLLVNNAGVTILQSILEMPEESIDYLINLDFRNYIVMMQLAIRYMARCGTKGTVINITSSRGQRAYPGDALYGGLKAGLNRAIESIALDAAPYGIRVNNVAPGAICIRTKEEIVRELGDKVPTDFWDVLGQRIPLERAGTPADIADAVAFLASEQASYITGVTLRVDGGLILPGMPEIWSEEFTQHGWGYSKKEKFEE